MKTKAPQGISDLRSEAAVKKDLKKRFAAWGAWHFSPPASAYGRSGIPDHVVCVPVVVTQAMVGKRLGLFVGVEAKAEGRRGEENAGLSALQIEQLRGISEAEGLSVRADSLADLAMIEEFIGFRERATK